MALGTPTLIASAGANGVTSVTTAAFTPTANAILLALCGSRNGAINPVPSDSLGGTWTLVNANSDQNSNTLHGTLYYREVGASPASMTVTSTSTNSGGNGVHVIEITGAGIDFSNFQFAINTTGDPSLTMGAFAGSSLCMAFAVGNTGAGFTQPSGYTELLDTAITTNLRMNSSYDVSSPGTAHTWTSTSGDSVAFGLEVKEPSGGSTYNESRDEILTVAETVTGLGIFPRSVSEVLTVAETVSALGVFTRSISEVLTAVETVSATAIFGRNVAETLTIIDATTGGLLQTGAVAEILSAVDTVTVAHVKAGSVAEVLSIAETVSSQLVAIGSRAEVLAIAEAVSGNLMISGSRTEVLAAIETVTGTVVAAPAGYKSYALIIG